MLKKSIFLEDEQDTWKYDYDGRYRLLRLICKDAGNDKAVVHVQEFNLKHLDDLLILLGRLKSELFPRTLT